MSQGQALCPCQQHYHEQNDGDKPIVLLVMAIGLEVCRSIVDMILSCGTIKPTKKHFVEEAQRRFHILKSLDPSRRARMPRKVWDIRRIKLWLQNNPVQGESNMKFVSTMLNATGFGLNCTAPNQPVHEKRFKDNDKSSVDQPNAMEMIASISQCEIHYLQQDDAIKPKVLLLMACGLPCCQHLVDMILACGTIKPSKENLVHEGQRRFDLHHQHKRFFSRPARPSRPGVRFFPRPARPCRPGVSWKVANIHRWLRKHPIEGESNIEFVRRTLETTNYGFHSNPQRNNTHNPGNDGADRNKNEPKEVAAALPPIKDDYGAEAFLNFQPDVGSLNDQIRHVPPPNGDEPFAIHPASQQQDRNGRPQHETHPSYLQPDQYSSEATSLRSSEFAELVLDVFHLQSDEDGNSTSGNDSTSLASRSLRKHAFLPSHLLDLESISSMSTGRFGDAEHSGNESPNSSDNPSFLRDTLRPRLLREGSLSSMSSDNDNDYESMMEGYESTHSLKTSSSMATSAIVGSLASMSAGRVTEGHGMNGNESTSSSKAPSSKRAPRRPSRRAIGHLGSLLPYGDVVSIDEGVALDLDELSLDWT